MEQWNNWNTIYIKTNKVFKLIYAHVYTHIRTRRNYREVCSTRSSCSGNDDMQEKKIEQKLVKEVKRCGGKCWKFVSPGTDGVPDRIVLLYKGKIGFVETKAPGEDLRPQQKKRKRDLEKLGFKVYVLDNESEIGGIIDEIRST